MKSASRLPAKLPATVSVAVIPAELAVCVGDKVVATVIPAPGVRLDQFSVAWIQYAFRQCFGGTQ